jgi:hypothetical protein
MEKLMGFFKGTAKQEEVGEKKESTSQSAEKVMTKTNSFF